VSPEEIDDGGPVSKMSVRDLFASSATEEDISRYENRSYQREDGIWATTTREQAKYIYADAMIAAGKKGVVL
jgi:hypothetical protein